MPTTTTTPPPRTPQANFFASNTFFHPYRIALYLSLASITALFLGTTGAYVFTRLNVAGFKPIHLPLVFVFNTLILLGSSATLHWANTCYHRDDTRNYQRALAYTLGLTLLFVVMQYVGWSMLDLRSHPPTGKAYIYAISILHVIHIVGGLPFFVLFLVTAVRRMREPVSVLIYFSDPAKRLKLELLTTYWHFLDVLWIYLVVFFTLNAIF